MVISYVVDHFCVRFPTGVVPDMAVSYIIDHYCVWFPTGVVPDMVVFCNEETRKRESSRFY
jgi:hypothetical protein